MSNLFRGRDPGFLGGIVPVGSLLRGAEGYSGEGVGRGGGEVRRGSGAGGDDGQELKVGSTTVANLTQ